MPNSPSALGRHDLPGTGTESDPFSGSGQGSAVFYAHFACKPASWFYTPAMPKKPVLTITEFARMGGCATLRKYGKRQLRAWGKLGGRPKKTKEQ